MGEQSISISIMDMEPGRGVGSGQLLQISNHLLLKHLHLRNGVRCSAVLTNKVMKKLIVTCHTSSDHLLNAFQHVHPS
jgi:hypothetical protein